MNTYLCHGSLRHNRRVMMIDFPLAILPNVYERVSTLDFSTGRSHREFIDSNIGASVFTNGYVTFEDFTLSYKDREV